MRYRHQESRPDRRNLASDWINARLIAEARGGKFVGVLQPVAYVGSPNISYLPDVEKDAMLRQYDVVYPMIEPNSPRRAWPTST